MRTRTYEVYNPATIEDKLYIPTLQFFAMGMAVYFAVYIYFAIN